MKDLFITGIDTGIGKTLTSAIFARALAYDYWKPIQCGSLEKTDSDVIRDLLSCDISKVHAESYIFKKPASPHIAAGDQHIDMKKIERPTTEKSLIIEGAGGILVPINNKHYIVDLIQKFNCHVVVVSKNYIGSINHTLLTLEALKIRGISILGVVFNGEKKKEIENSILSRCKIPELLHILPEKKINSEIIMKYAERFKRQNVIRTL